MKRVVVTFPLWLICTYLIFHIQPTLDFSEYTSSLAQNFDRIIHTPISQNDSLITERMDFIHAADTILTAHLRIPKSGKPLPFLLLLGGMQTGKDAINFAYGVNNIGLIAPDYGYKMKKHYSFGDILAGLNEAHKALHDQVRNNLILLNFLYSRPDLADTAKIGILAYSFGVPFAVATAPLSNRVDNLALVYGGADLYSLIGANLRLKPEYYRRFMANLLYFHVMDFEPAEHAQKLRSMRLIMVNGVSDKRIPAANARKLSEAFAGPPEIIWIQSGHVHPKKKNLNLEIISILKNWYKEIL